MATTKVTTDVIDMSGNTGGLTWVKGTTAEQPSGVIGEIREDTDTKRALVYTDETGSSEWRNLKEESVSANVDYLIVGGGGGGGGWFRAGGGGAGGLRTSYDSTGSSSPPSGGGAAAETQFSTALDTNVTVTVGAGGAGGVYTQNGTNGDDSKFGTVGAEITSKGGGGGGYYGTVNANAGGSGGGSAGFSSTTGTPGAGETNQGFAGGQGQAGNPQSGGGGGGAGAVGQAGGSAATSGDGGDGVKTLILPYTEAGTAGVGEQISGTEVWYAGGGGSGSYELGNDSIPGKGGGGEGGYNLTPPPYPDGSPGADGTGGGGGGSAGSTGVAGTGGAGGKGVVILRYSGVTLSVVSGSLVQSSGSPFTDSSTGDTISVFTSGDGLIKFT